MRPATNEVFIEKLYFYEGCREGSPFFFNMLHHDTFYRSNEQFHVRFDAVGNRDEESYYLFYHFRPDGIWLCKTTDEPRIQLPDFLATLDMAEILFDPHQSEPMDDNRELQYQSGTYEIRANTVWCKWKNQHLEERERNWYFRGSEAGIGGIRWA